MAEEIQLGSAEGIQLRLQYAPKAKGQEGLLWAHGRLLVAGDPVWENDDASPVEWTWIDLLEWLARNWKYLMYEQSLPFNESTLSMNTLLRDLQRRWEDMPQSRVEEEEEHALRFLHRHDMAYGFKGLFLPTLYLFRVGRLMEIALPALKTETRLPLARVATDLEAIGNGLAENAVEHVHSRAKAAVSLWQGRAEQEPGTVVRLMTGLSLDELKALSGDADLSFWEMEDMRQMDDTEMLAAARMTVKVLTPEQQRRLLDRIKIAPRNDTAGLDNLSVCIREQLQPEERPHDQGYWAANQLRRLLELGEKDPVDPAALLNNWNVNIAELPFEASGIDALACWGPRHGPVLFLNREDGSPAHAHGERSTLAHEICHLLLDRHDALPVAEVLKGHTPERLEKRARAFAAEFLLPRSAAAAQVRAAGDLKKSVRSLSDSFGVSEALVCWQIYNSGLSTALSGDERQWLMAVARSES